MTGATVRSSLSAIFARWVCHSTLLTDNGWQFCRQHFQRFAKAYDLHHITTSPHFPQSNDKTERSLACPPQLQSDPIKATGYSPAQLMLGVQMWTPIPTLEEKLLPRWLDITLVKAADARAKAAYKHYYDRCHSSRPLAPAQAGWKRLCCSQTCQPERMDDNHHATPEILLHSHQWWHSLQKQTAPVSADAPHPELEDGEETDIINTAETDSGQQQDNETTTQTPAVVITSRGRVVKQPSQLKDFLVST